VGYEHQKRGNPRGMASLLGQGAEKLRDHTRRRGVRELRERALRDAEIASGGGERWQRIAPPKLMLTITGCDARGPASAIRIVVPRASNAR
jgi:hypothetical protein